MMFWLLLRNEFTKLKSTLALWMMLLMPLAIVLLTSLLLLNKPAERIIQASQFAQQSLAFWMLLIQPMYLAIAAVLLLSLEHRAHGWQRLYVLPIKRGTVYLAKTIVLLFLQTGAVLVLLALTWLSMGVLAIGGQLQFDAISFGDFLLAMTRGLCGGWIVLVIQQYLSTRWSSFMVPMMVAVAGSLTIPSVAQSSRFWPFDPWSYGLVASAVNSVDAQQLALLLSSGLSVVVVCFAVWDIGRQELR